MKSFLLAYHGGTMGQTKEEQAKNLAAWGTWYQKMGAAVVDGGNPVGRTMTVMSGGSTRDGGGPNPVSGYTIISAGTIDDAVKLAKDCPVLTSGGSVEVCETFAAM